LLDWLLDQAEQNVPEALRGASVPVAWMGRTSTDDKQDPTLPLPRQLDLTRGALPDGFVIVAKFYDVESGRTAPRHRGRGHAHELLDIPIARDGSITDLLSEARQSDRRFVAVVCESSTASPAAHTWTHCGRFNGARNRTHLHATPTADGGRRCRRPLLPL
jgi:hypothetical protein